MHLMDKNLICIKDSLISCLKSEVDRGTKELDTEETGKVADIIKDITQAQKCCMEAMYYETVIEAMRNGEDDYYDEYEGKRGYSESKRMSRHKPYVDQQSYIREYMRQNDSAGYGDSRYGKAYNDYQQARRHYTQTNSPAYRDEMKAHASEHIGDTISTIREIWSTADPELRMRMKSDLTALVGEMTV